MSSSGPGPRDYSTGTVRALFALSGTTCYHPDCQVTVVRFLDDEPFSDVQIAHIRSANADGPRYDPSMTDDQRRAFPNLMLLCKPHHELVDKRHPERYSIETLSKWKADREEAAGIDRQPLSGVTEEGLIEAILKAVASAPPQRAAKVELGLGLSSPRGFLSFPVETAKDYLYLDTYKDQGTPSLSILVRNTGTLKLYVNREAIFFNPSGAGLLGTTHFLYNPLMPCPLDGGKPAQWFYDLSMVSQMVHFIRQQGKVVKTLVAKIELGSGEEFESDPMPVAYLPDWRALSAD